MCSKNTKLSITIKISGITAIITSDVSTNDYNITQTTRQFENNTNITSAKGNSVGCINTYIYKNYNEEVFI